MRLAAKVDKTQRGIIKALRAVGCSVWPTHTAGRGAPDLVVGVPERSAVHSFFAPRKTLLLEVKSPGGKLTPDQEKWHAAWRGAPVVIVETVEQALEAVK